ncbi:unnamed protein product [Notodromas monacha]|uniref:BZIP domain-containing protein n=1 Tax=Notodromas monacha TaxID=399045 RepID=A0A7R9BS44_9CRUS|nr:unnamed protein product [Notodromas monacha]CAG0919772.1 unnamed protein product [Notodromas monacha]
MSMANSSSIPQLGSGGDSMVVGSSGPTGRSSSAVVSDRRDGAGGRDAVSNGARSPEWTGLAPHPSLMIPTGPYAHDVSRSGTADSVDRSSGRSRGDRSPPSIPVSASGAVPNVPPQKKHQFYGRRTGNFQDSQGPGDGDDGRDGMMSPTSASTATKTSYLTDSSTGWILSSSSQPNAGSSATAGNLSPQVPVPLHGSAAAYQSSPYVIDTTPNLGLGASAATFGAATGNWHQQLQSTHHQGFSFDPVKYQCSYDYSGAMRHPSLDAQVGINNVQHTHSYSAAFGEPSGLIRSHQVPLPISSSSSTGSRRGSKGYSKEDSQACRDEKRASQLGIPIPVQEIINLPMDEFNERLSKHDLTEAQLSLIRDIRRRGKNKVAAQNCRKRKLDQIVSLSETVTQLRTKRERHDQELLSLRQRRSQLTSRYSALYRHISQQLRDNDGKLLSPYEYGLEHTGEDGKVVVVPLSSSTSVQLGKDENGHPVGSHEALHHQQAYEQTYVMVPGGYHSDLVMSYGAPDSYCKREDDLSGPHG